MRRQHVPSPVPSHSCIANDDVDRWKQRWEWLRTAPLPNNVREFMWRRWNGHLYLGENAEQPIPRCPFCDGTDSVSHFFFLNLLKPTQGHSYKQIRTIQSNPNKG